jgi:internalin A
MTGGATGGIPHDCGTRIDDVEDGTGRICMGSGRVGAWYAFNDQNARSAQWPAPTLPGTPIETSLIPGGRAASQRGMHTFGSASGWGAGIGFDLNFDGATYRVYDASRYEGVHFWARSRTGGSTLRFRVSTASTTAVKYGGTCQSGAPTECVGPAPVLLQLEPDWLEYTVSFAELARATERDRLTNIQFMAQGDFDFWIDDVSFIEGAPNCCPNLPACQGGVHFSDASVRRALPSPNDSAALLSCAQVCALRSVRLADPAIQSLSGFECLSALDTLTLSTTAVTDLAPLSNLVGLHELSVSQGKVSELRPLAALRELRALNLENNQIADVRALAGLVKLQALSLTDNALTDIAPLANLTALKKLLLASNQIQDASPVSQLAALQELDLHQNRISYLGPPFQMPLLPELNLDDNQVTDVTALGSLSALTQLSLIRNQVKDASPLARLHLLSRLHLSGNRVTTPLGAFSGLSQLWELNLSQNQIGSLGSVSELPQLLYLDLAYNQLKDVSELSSLSSLSSLSLGHNQISDPHALAALTQLVDLDLSSNSILTLSGSFAFTRLHRLDLSSNGLGLIPEAALNGTVMNTVLLAHNHLLELNAFAHVSLVPWVITGSGRNSGSTTEVALLNLSDNQVQELAPLVRAAWQNATIVAAGNLLDCTALASTLQSLRAQKNSVDVCP